MGGSEAKYTERQMTLALRGESARARCAALYATRPTFEGDHRAYHIDGPCRDCRQKALERFPLPKVTRPRVVALSGAEYRVVGGRIEAKISGRVTWNRAGWTAEEITGLADLLATPNETVEDES